MIRNLRKTTIICTLGPASENIIEDLVMAGMNIARVNFSHGGKEENEPKIKEFKNVREKLNMPLALMLDTQGPEIRTGLLSEKYKDGVQLNNCQKYILTNKGEETDNCQASISYKELYKDVKIGDRILMDDGAICLEIEKIEGENIHCIVLDGGILKTRKSVNIPGVYLNNPTLSPKDIADLKYAAEAEFEFVAASFVRNKEDVLEIRKILDENGGTEVEIISKIENRQALENLDEILEVSNGVMIARGDLAVEIPFDEVPIWQKEIISRSNRMGKPVIVATQMLESMISNPTPTRAEASDVANAVYDKASAVMLSGETAVGKYPVKCVEAMSNICDKVESKLRYWGRIRELSITRGNLENNASAIVTEIAKSLKADLIVAYTHTGKSVNKLAGLGAACPIFSVTDNPKTYNKLALTWNVFPIYMEKQPVIDEMMGTVIEKMKKEKLVEDGNIAILSGGKNYIKGVKESKRIGGVIVI